MSWTSHGMNGWRQQLLWEEEGKRGVWMMVMVVGGKTRCGIFFRISFSLFSSLVVSSLSLKSEMLKRKLEKKKMHVLIWKRRRSSSSDSLVYTCLLFLVVVCHVIQVSQSLPQTLNIGKSSLDCFSWMIEVYSLLDFDWRELLFNLSSGLDISFVDSTVCSCL